MTTSIQPFPAPCFLATSRGFYRGNPNELFHNLLIFTSNIRQATVFDSFEAAEKVFSALLANRGIELADYCAIVTTVQLPLSPAPAPAPANELLNPVLKRCTCLRCLFSEEREESNDNDSN